MVLAGKEPPTSSPIDSDPALRDEDHYDDFCHQQSMDKYLVYLNTSTSVHLQTTSATEVISPCSSGFSSNDRNKLEGMSSHSSVAIEDILRECSMSSHTKRFLQLEEEDGCPMDRYLAYLDKEIQGDDRDHKLSPVSCSSTQMEDSIEYQVQMENILNEDLEGPEDEYTRGDPADVEDHVSMFLAMPTY